MSESLDFRITPTLLLRAYAAGVFPMAQSADAEDIFWVDPKRRGVLPLDAFHVPKSLKKRIRKGGFFVTCNRDFKGVLDGCAGREETWINPEIAQLYTDLNAAGRAQSIEVWMDGVLAGGLYGVSLGSAWFGESMFSRRPDASKIALVWLVARLRHGGYTLLDTQFVTGHLGRFGATEIDRADYHQQLEDALQREADFFALSEGAPAERVLQLSTQTS
ncbi:leucyl/phenylalanyl-tRNA--protein transferase [Rhodovulum sp. DZ06]|uniref:leucyl/phenylalanyl-tRNA--protein transferase n=1 Tax=Rhodovulum sp. DZ06 TaxID=3425126 RepID=UPI003D34543D